MPKVNKRKRATRSDEIDLSLSQPSHLQSRKPYITPADSEWSDKIFIFAIVLIVSIIAVSL